MGDITGRYMFSHAANFESEYLANQIADNRDEPIDYGPMPHSVFTSPESAGVQGFRAPARRNTDYEMAQLSASAISLFACPAATHLNTESSRSVI
jgi:mycothione reductase